MTKIRLVEACYCFTVAGGAAHWDELCRAEWRSHHWRWERHIRPGDPPLLVVWSNLSTLAVGPIFGYIHLIGHPCSWAKQSVKGAVCQFTQTQSWTPPSDEEGEKDSAEVEHCTDSTITKVNLWHRCENERMLMAMYGIDSEGGEDIPQQGKSYFLDLLQQGTKS